MKRIPQLSILALLAITLVACTAVQAAPATVTPPPGQAEDASCLPAHDTPRTITVVGVGKVSLVPEVAHINVGAEVRADTVSAAKGEVDRQIEAIHAVLVKMGIEAKDIQVNHYSIHLEREPMPMVVRDAPTGPAQEGYRVSNMLRVTVRDVERASALLDAVVEAGANQVYGVDFTVSDPDAWQSEAREKAIADANARAAELAGLTGVELGKVLSVSEVIGGMMAPSLLMGRSIGGGGGGFAPGELEMSTQVQVTFALQ
jgi:uncharacterized protein YggE